MEYLFVSLLLLGCTYYTIKSAVKDAFYDILKSLKNINITYAKNKTTDELD